jgi:hypothetical protein
VTRIRKREQKLADDTSLLRCWRAWHREQLDQALAGPHGAVIRPIVELLGDLTPQKMPTLLDLLRAQDWRIVDADVRYELLHLINTAITKLRERENRPPIDDALPDESPTLFLLARDMLSGSKPGNPAGVITATR